MLRASHAIRDVAAIDERRARDILGMDVPASDDVQVAGEVTSFRMRRIRMSRLHWITLGERRSMTQDGREGD
jgi:hypothetical protein